MALKLIGYWCNPSDPRGWPHPRRLVTRWEPSLQRQMIDYLRRGRICVMYRGWSYCRFGCGKNGGSELTDGVFAWPEGLAHYIERHSVRLPAEFIAHASAERFLIPAGAHDLQPHQEPYDMTFWAAWCRREAPPSAIDRWRTWLARHLDRPAREHRER